ncbi:MAG: sensor histidine kinase [Rhodoferax sp.]|uniref:sensor histidine kinase n=1 Tax=Rhodoferax sp. TaxID=50421 RepID=UPI0026088A85|nr:sensor histidine kinase [Rhodoferax sp.]MDD5333954.1 sensor histidine kinase [Rhodoferax sp.]
MQLFIAAVVALLMALPLGATPLTLTADMPRASLEGRLEHFADASDTLAFEAVRQRDFTLLPAFRSQNYDAAAHWYRFELSRAAGAPARWILAIGSPTLDEVDVWVEQPEGAFLRYALGDHRPYEARPLQTRLFAVPVEVPARTRIYMRVQTTSTINVNAEVWQPEAFIANETRGNLYRGLYFGILLIVAMFYSILAAWLRDAIMGAYAGYVASLVLLHLGHNGYLPVVFASDSTWLNDALMRVGFLGGTAFVALMWDRLLELRRNFSRIHRLYMLIGLVNVAALPLVATASYRVIAPSINLIAMSIGIINPILLGIFWWRSRRAELMVYFIAFVIPMVGGLTLIAMEMGWVPQNALTSNLYQITSLVHVLVMSFGLALRLRQMQHDKAAAEQGVLVAAQRTEEQRRFVAMLSHEFRNPLAAIDRSAQMIEIKTPDLAISEAKRLTQIRGNVATLSGLVDNFLLTEALDHQAMALSREPCAIRPLLEGVLQMQREEVGERIQLTVVPPDALFHLDPTLIGMAVGNLVANALRYSPPDSPVEIAATVDATGLRIRVVDRGPGMREEELAMLGQPYYRAGSSLGKKGSGLGYYFTRRIVEAHGGSLRASSRSGEGMEVEIRLA